MRIFDTTLRDGEQSPGATLTSSSSLRLLETCMILQHHQYANRSEKLEIAKQLAKLGVDVIEAGFPIASPDDFEAVRQIARVVGNEVDEVGHVPVICGLSRANVQDIERAWEAVKSAQLPRVHTFIATSNIHMETKLCKTPDEVVQIAVDAVTFARSLGCDDIEFSPEDAGRSDVQMLPVSVLKTGFMKTYSCVGRFSCPDFRSCGGCWSDHVNNSVKGIKFELLFFIGSTFPIQPAGTRPGNLVNL